MKKLSIVLCTLSILIVASCSINNYDPGLSSADGLGFSSSEASRSSSSSSGGSSSNNPNSAGLITAGEWNDLENWSFYTNLTEGNGTYAGMSQYWDFYTNNRIAISVQNGGNPSIDAKVELRKNGELIWSTRTDNSGLAELWVGLFDKDSTAFISDYSLFVNGQMVLMPLTWYKDGVNNIQTLSNPVSLNNNQVEIAFLVDATGSMGDELEFLKDDFMDVINQVQNSNSLLSIETGAVFYRDEGDDYVVRHSDFSTDPNTTLGFINQQSAGGGGNFPEAVHTALETGLENLDWSDHAKTRIAFLILDAPPHHNDPTIESLQQSIQEYAKKGIKIIPVTASGIGKNTEFLMRFLAAATNGTYVFITDDSGIGNDHLEATVGDFEVEFLNDLMVRLIKEYTN